MKETAYALLQRYIRFGFYCYYKEIRMDGIEKLSRQHATLVLPNHQNALLDPLAIAAFAPRPPWFLTRSDVFTGPRLKAFFRFLRMMPIYRIRDGRDSLGKNRQVFKNCSEILRRKQAIVMFPEANHNLARKVRPLSKGFTRILFETRASYPGISIEMLPVGLNYQKGEGFPDRLRFIFGEPIQVDDLISGSDERANVIRLRQAVSTALKKLTTHIDHPDYEAVTAHLNEQGTDYLDPVAVNQLWPTLTFEKINPEKKLPRKNAWDYITEILNLPIVLLWRMVVKPKVPEPEFTATYRFVFALLAFPLFYLLLVVALWLMAGFPAALLVTVGHFLLNLLYVKVR